MAAKAKNTKARGDATPAAELILEVLAPVAVELLWGEVEVAECLISMLYVGSFECGTHLKRLCVWSYVRLRLWLSWS